MLACVKGLQGAIPTGEVIFFRSFIAMFPLLIWLKIQGNVLASIKTKNIFGHLIRGFSGTGGMYTSTIWRWCRSPSPTPPP